MITSLLPSRMSGMACSCASRSEVQFAFHIHCWIRASSKDTLLGLELEVCKFVTGTAHRTGVRIFRCEAVTIAGILLDIYLTDHVPPIT